MMPEWSDTGEGDWYIGGARRQDEDNSSMERN